MEWSGAAATLWRASTHRAKARRFYPVVRWAALGELIHFEKSISNVLSATLERRAALFSGSGRAAGWEEPDYAGWVCTVIFLWACNVEMR
jgi:hypothetical protein